MKEFGAVFLFFILPIGLVVGMGLYENSFVNPYEKGSHLDYTIIHENGIVYKQTGGRYGGLTVIYDSDGTPLKVKNIGKFDKE